MYSRKMVLMSQFAGQQWRHRHREQICGLNGGRRGGKEAESGRETTICKIDRQWEFAI